MSGCVNGTTPTTRCEWRRLSLGCFQSLLSPTERPGKLPLVALTRDCWCESPESPRLATATSPAALLASLRSAVVLASRRARSEPAPFSPTPRDHTLTPPRPPRSAALLPHSSLARFSRALQPKVAPGRLGARRPGGEVCGSLAAAVLAESKGEVARRLRHLAARETRSVSRCTVGPRLTT